MDIEWGLDERTSKLWILQARLRQSGALRKEKCHNYFSDNDNERKIIVKGSQPHQD